MTPYQAVSIIVLLNEGLGAKSIEACFWPLRLYSFLPLTLAFNLDLSAPLEIANKGLNIFKGHFIICQLAGKICVV